MTGCERHEGGEAAHAAMLLKRALEPFGIAADVHDGHGVALLSVWVELIVWTEGRSYWWATGRESRGGQRLYTCHTTNDPRGAARRIAARCAAVRKAHPLSGLVEEWAA